MKILDCRFQIVLGSFNLQSEICNLKFRLKLLWQLANRIQRSNFPQRIQFVLAQFRDAMNEIVNRSEWSDIALTDNCVSSLLAQPANITKAQRSAGVPPAALRAVPSGIRWATRPPLMKLFR